MMRFLCFCRLTFRDSRPVRHQTIEALRRKNHCHPKSTRRPLPGRTRPCADLFGALVERAFIQTLGVYESHVADYLADVLADFAHMQQVCKIRDLSGRPLEEVGRHAASS